MNNKILIIGVIGILLVCIFFMVKNNTNNVEVEINNALTFEEIIEIDPEIQGKEPSELTYEETMQLQESLEKEKELMMVDDKVEDIIEPEKDK